MKLLTVGTRSSKLALTQADEAIRQLRAHYPNTEFRVIPIETGGDKSPSAPLNDLGLGAFVREIEDVLIQGTIDMAVHSLKDLTPTLPKELTISAVLERGDPRDILINRWKCNLLDLPSNARIGTSSPRRTAQLKAQIPNLDVLPIRGNIDTRIKKAIGDSYDGVILAASGLIRLGLENNIAQYLPIEEFVPAAAQGAIAIETRRDNELATSVANSINHINSRQTVTAERAFLEILGGGCQEPSAAHAQVSGTDMVMFAFMSSQDGQRVFKTKTKGLASNPQKLAQDAHQSLVDQGAHVLTARWSGN